MNFDHRQEDNASADEFIAAQLRHDAPQLPPHLRQRVLARCHDAQDARTSRQRRAPWRLASTLTALCVAQWLLVAWLDAQNRALIAGHTAAPLYATNNHAASPPRLAARESDEPEAPSAGNYFRFRSRTIAALLNESRGGL